MNNWTQNVIIPGRTSSSKKAPSIVVHNNLLHLFLHQSSGGIFHHTFDGFNWTLLNSNAIPNIEPAKDWPAVVSFNGVIHMFIAASSSSSRTEGQIIEYRFVNNQWIEVMQNTHVVSDITPAATTYAGRLHLFSKLKGGRNPCILHSVFDGISWTAADEIPQHFSKKTPSVISYQTELHMVHIGESSSDMWHSQFDGQSWSTPVKIPNQKSWTTVGMTVFDERIQMVHLGSKPSKTDIWHTTFDGVWTANVKIPGQKSKKTPALTVFRGEMYLIHIGGGGSSIDMWISRCIL